MGGGGDYINRVKIYLWWDLEESKMVSVKALGIKCFFFFLISCDTCYY